ncbi:helix-turn-helix transcriptional regulator [Streptomyces sp. H27-H5]|uniref:helix-turn-helix transcriptional regulator n=1 Tax=Streptomyces sp. H27-H5 TaxID=2996460 RepID=UPI0022707E93|nr:winged helix-turn-helix transcriptional regulator [Streptomyces sp. H27-H5]MCY0960851.1 hypothetical protein [Streptomyces sp. H27-H5]
MFRTTARPPLILVGATGLAILSLIWSGYAITDLMHSGKFGLSVAIAGDIGWLTVLRAEYRGITISVRTRTITPAAVGWAIALGVAALLALHGHEQHSLPQTLAGPFVVLVGKAVWTLALASLRDPAALTPDQEAEIASVMRDSEYEARLHAARLDQLDRAADSEIARIRAEARITLARDDADAEIQLERIDKQRAITRRTPLAISPAQPAPAHVEPPAQPVEPSPPSVEPTRPHTVSAVTVSQVSMVEPEVQPAEPFGFSVAQSAQSKQREESLRAVAKLLAADPGLTSGQIAETLSVSPATAKRYLREARKPS